MTTIHHFFPKLIYKFNSILTEVQARDFMELDMLILKLTWQCKQLVGS